MFIQFKFVMLVSILTFYVLILSMLTLHSFVITCFFMCSLFFFHGKFFLSILNLFIFHGEFSLSSYIIPFFLNGLSLSLFTLFFLCYGPFVFVVTPVFFVMVFHFRCLFCSSFIGGSSLSLFHWRLLSFFVFLQFIDATPLLRYH
jgi:hypothetical protein